MIKLYLKQAWEMVKQNKLFTFIYVVGTAIAIATTMIMAIVYYVKIAPIYPEVNRNRTLYITSLKVRHKTLEYNNQWAYSYLAVKEWFYTLKNVEAVSAILSNGYGEATDYIQPFDGSGDFPVKVKLTDPAFFRIYSFHFIEGKPFTEADRASGLRSVVISDILARRLFGTVTGLVGKHFKMNDMDYRITGVVESASYLASYSYAQVYAPYSTHEGYDVVRNNPEQYGAFSITLMVGSDTQETALRKEFDEIVRKFNATSEKWVMKPGHQPYTHLTSVFHDGPTGEFSWTDVIRHYLVIFLVLLLVPALNLGGMIAGRMETRLSEMGIRKSFGACRQKLLSQVMWENLLLTLAGGLLGLILSWTALVLCRNWIFALFEERPNVMLEGINVELTDEMLLSPAVFAIALLLCVALNLLSALIPAVCSLRNPIIKSLNEKR